MNRNNLAQKTNFIAGSDKFKDITFYLTTVNIPGMTFAPVDVGGRDSVQIKLASDVVTFSSLSLEMLIDEDLLIYKELMGIINEHINIEEGTFTELVFDFWIELKNSKNAKILKVEFVNCRIESIGDISFDVQDDVTEQTLSLELAYDYYQFEDTRTVTERV